MFGLDTVILLAGAHRVYELRVELTAVAAGCCRHCQHLERRLAVVHAVHDEELRREGAPVLGGMDVTRPPPSGCD